VQGLLDLVHQSGVLELTAREIGQPSRMQIWRSAYAYASSIVFARFAATVMSWSSST